MSWPPVIGLLIGAVIVQWGTWPWLFYSFSILGAIVFGIVAALSPPAQHASTLGKLERFKRLDLFGVFLVTGEIVSHCGHCEPRGFVFCSGIRFFLTLLQE
jgi:MFS family permease